MNELDKQISNAALKLSSADAWTCNEQTQEIIDSLKSCIEALKIIRDKLPKEL